MTTNTLIHIIVVLLVCGLILWAVEQFPLDPMFRNLIRVVAVVGACLWLLNVAGLLKWAL